MKRISFLMILFFLTFSAVPVSQIQAAPNCTDEVVVQADDWLSKIADRFYSNPLAYEVIFEATNEMAVEDNSFATITDPNVIEPGWKLCIVSPAEATGLLDQSSIDTTTTTTGQSDQTNADTPMSDTAAPEADQPVRVGLELFADGLTSPLALVPSPDETGRLFVIDQVGTIQIIDSEGVMMAEPFLDISDQLVQQEGSYDERGLLGLAFHPDFAQNGRFFVYYSAPLRDSAPADWDHTSHISELTVSDPSANQADPSSERILLQVDQPQSNHDAGQIAFGPDGYLYIPLGDGGAANDVALGHSEMGNGQDTTNILGSILRIDVDSGEPYGIPADNPFVGDDNIPDEIFAYGFRNPYRIAFDRGGDGSLFVSDAGQDRWEEVDIVTSGGNYGWHIKEGTHCFDPDNPGTSPAECAATGANGQPLIDPIIEYQNANAEGGLGLVVVGGFVYRGQALPELAGRYIFGDWSTSFEQPDGTLLIADSSAATAEGLRPIQTLEITTNDNGKLNAYLLSFGQDRAGEIYALTTATAGPTGTTGKIFKIVPAESNN
jgi:glucose/arabinose dehydrogenase